MFPGRRGILRGAACLASGKQTSASAAKRAGSGQHARLARPPAPTCPFRLLGPERWFRRPAETDFLTRRFVLRAQNWWATCLESSSPRDAETNTRDAYAPRITTLEIFPDSATLRDMETTQPLSPADRERRLALARKAFHDFQAQCFWFWKDDPDITEETIPLIIRELRLNGGHAGYRMAVELCR